MATSASRSIMEKSIGIMLLQLIGASIVSGLSVAGTGSASSIMNNSLNPYAPATASGSILSTTSSPSIFDAYLATFPFNEQQSVLTTTYQGPQSRVVVSSTSVLQDNEKTSTFSSLSSSMPTHVSTETSHAFSSNQNTQIPISLSTFAASAGTSSSSSSSSSTSPSLTSPNNTDIEQQVIITAEHELLGCGPNNREGIGIQKALDWLREKRASDYGWDNDTHMVILAKELSNGRDPSDNDGHLQIISDLENMLSIKQMEVDILIMLDKHRSLISKPLETDRLARYILSLGSLCKDPRRFYGHDLITFLQHHEPTQDDEFALATLAACSSATHVRKRQIRRLLDIASGEITNIDTMAMVLLALRCIITDHRHRHLQHFIRRPALGLAGLQGPRGSFGSLRSTALAMQALQDLQLEGASTYNRTAASKWILDRQRTDGGWTEEPLQDGQDPSIGVGLTADIILALGCKGLGAVRALQCDHVIREANGNADNSENGDQKIAQPVGLPSSSAEDTEQKNVTYSYTLWLESNITEIYSLNLVSPKNTSFFKAMTQAADQDSRFAFEAREWPNGHYIHTLAGKKEEPTLYHYWLLYRLPEMPDSESPPGNQLIAPVGVDELMVEDGEHYLYWYKKL